MEKKRQRRQKSAYISSSILKAINMHNLSLRVCVYTYTRYQTVTMITMMNVKSQKPLLYNVEQMLTRAKEYRNP